MTPRTAQQKTCQSHEFHDHVAGAARGPRETYTTTGGRRSAFTHQTHTYQQKYQHKHSSLPSKPQTLRARDDAHITTSQTKPSDPFHIPFLPLFSHTPHHKPLPHPHALQKLTTLPPTPTVPQPNYPLPKILPLRKIIAPPLATSSSSTYSRSARFSIFVRALTWLGSKLCAVLRRARGMTCRIRVCVPTKCIFRL